MKTLPLAVLCTAFKHMCSTTTVSLLDRDLGLKKSIDGRLPYFTKSCYMDSGKTYIEKEIKKSLTKFLFCSLGFLFLRWSLIVLGHNFDFRLCGSLLSLV